jgi:hypothetical protein
MRRFALVCAVFLVLLTSVSAAREITVESGETVLLATDTRAELPVSRVSIDYSIPETDFQYYFQETWPDSEVISEELTFNLRPGNYRMDIVATVERTVTRREQVIVHVVPNERQRREWGLDEPVAAQNTTNRTTPRTGPQPRITIQRIPDVTPGTTILIPVTITGTGEYQIEVPQLPFGTHEVQGPVFVNGSATIPILLHVSERATPGTYTIPVHVGDQEASVRIRIIKYTTQKNYLWLLIPLGIIIIILGVFLLLNQRRKQMPPPKRTTDNDKDLITYY